jgi:hypothetical protein
VIPRAFPRQARSGYLCWVGGIVACNLPSCAYRKFGLRDVSCRLAMYVKLVPLNRRSTRVCWAVPAHRRAPRHCAAEARLGHSC